MRYCLPGFLPILILLAAGCGGEDPAGSGPRGGLVLTCPAFGAGERIPARFTADGEDRSPPLAWSRVPAGTREFALVLEDPDAPGGLFIHWVLYKLPGTARGLDEGDNGSGVEGRTSWGRSGYNGPSPPPGRPHRYRFRLWALDAELELAANADRAALLRALSGHALAEAELVGTYGR